MCVCVYIHRKSDAELVYFDEFQRRTAFPTRHRPVLSFWSALIISRVFTHRTNGAHVNKLPAEYLCGGWVRCEYLDFYLQAKQKNAFVPSPAVIFLGSIN